MSKRLILNIDTKLHRAVKARAASVGLTITAVVLALLRLWLDGKIKLDED